MVLNLRKLQNYKITYDQVAYDAGEAEAARLPLHVERLRNRLLSFRCIVPVEVKVRRIHLELGWRDVDNI